jgi:hypothetical protein
MLQTARVKRLKRPSTVSKRSYRGKVGDLSDKRRNAMTPRSVDLTIVINIMNHKERSLYLARHLRPLG